jgi:hypothetical protein
LSYKIFLSHLITQKVENSPVNPDQKTADANRFRIIKLVYPPRNNSLLLASTTSSSADQHRSANRAPPERRATKSKSGIWLFDSPSIKYPIGGQYQFSTFSSRGVTARGRPSPVTFIDPSYGSDCTRGPAVAQIRFWSKCDFCNLD